MPQYPVLLLRLTPGLRTLETLDPRGTRSLRNGSLSLQGLDPTSLGETPVFVTELRQLRLDTVGSRLAEESLTSRLCVGKGTELVPPSGERRVTLRRPTKRRDRAFSGLFGRVE